MLYEHRAGLRWLCLQVIALKPALMRALSSLQVLAKLKLALPNLKL